MRSGRRPSPVARRWLVASGVLAVLSLGMIWRWSYTIGPGYFMPGFCYVRYDYEGWAYTQCDPYYQYGSITPTELNGFAHPVRVMLLLAVAALFFGYRRGSRALLLAAPALGALGLFAFGFTGRAGQLVFAAALVALLVSLHVDGVLRVPGADRLIRKA